VTGKVEEGKERNEKERKEKSAHVWDLEKLKRADICLSATFKSHPAKWGYGNAPE
jgi:hypothetical protein